MFSQLLNNPMSQNALDALETALLRADRYGAEETLRSLMQDKAGLQLAEAIMVVALERIGKAWEVGRASLSQIYLGGKICEDLAKTYFNTDSSPPHVPEKCAIALLNDYHELGKRIVLSALRSAGFTILDWGRATPEELVARTLESDLDALLISTLMLPSALAVGGVVNQLAARGFRGKILVGGAPFRLDAGLWREVGADATAANAMDSIQALARLLGRSA